MNIGRLASTAILPFVLSVGIVRAQEPDPGDAAIEAQAEPSERLNAVSFGAAYKFHALSKRDSAVGVELPEQEHLGGFVIAYQRVLIRERLSLVVAKPFLFNRERFDSPIDIAVKGLFRKGAWEPFLGGGISSNLRIFRAERVEAEGNRVEYALGIIAATGFSHFFTERWALELEVAYIWDVWINTRTGFEHELATVLGGVFYF